MSTRRAESHIALFLYFVALSVTITGWLRTFSVPLVDPIDGVGCWLGVAGASMMLLFLFYPVRIRITSLGFLVHTKYWFQMHVALGVLGPLLIAASNSDRSTVPWRSCARWSLRSVG